MTESNTDADVKRGPMRGLMVGLAAALLGAAIIVGAIVVAQDDMGGMDAALTDLEMSDEERATTLFEAFAAAPYTDWAFEPGVPAGYYVGAEPHGMILRSFIDEVAAADLEGGATEFSAGAVLIKENHGAEGVDVASMEAQAAVEGFEGALGGLTWMVKIPGYNPEAGDWFWANQAPDGSINAAGKPAGCIGCHGQVADNDWIFNASLGE